MYFTSATERFARPLDCTIDTTSFAIKGELQILNDTGYITYFVVTDIVDTLFGQDVFPMLGCDYGNPCTVNDTCIDGVCIGEFEPYNCDCPVQNLIGSVDSMERYFAIDTINSTQNLQEHSSILYESENTILLKPGFQTTGLFLGRIVATNKCIPKLQPLTERVNPKENPVLQKGFFITAYPNPTSDFITLKYELLQDSPISIDLLTLNGQKIKSWRKSHLQAAGVYTMTNDLTGLATGIYFVKAQTKDEVEVIKLVVQ